MNENEIAFENENINDDSDIIVTEKVIIPKRKRSKFVPVFAICMLLLFAAVFAGVYFGAKKYFGGTMPEVVSESESEPISEPESREDVSEESSSSGIDLRLVELVSNMNYLEQHSTAGGAFGPVVIGYPTDTAEWELICLNTKYRVAGVVDDIINLSYVAGSQERMDSRAAEWYNNMYNAAAADGIYLTPCSGYRSYKTQERLYNEFYNEYTANGYTSEEAHKLTSARRMPPGSSEHNIGICMDIILADSSAHFENTREYAWLQANAQEYGFILRYPEDKVDITGVKFEPWHWRYVGANSRAIKQSGLCLEEYLGLV